MWFILPISLKYRSTVAVTGFRRDVNNLRSDDPRYDVFEGERTIYYQYYALGRYTIAQPDTEIPKGRTLAYIPEHVPSWKLRTSVSTPWPMTPPNILALTEGPLADFVITKEGKVRTFPSWRHQLQNTPVEMSFAKYVRLIYDAACLTHGESAVIGAGYGMPSDRDMAAYTAAMKPLTTADVKFAVTADEIEYVYTHGPSSCMAHSVDQFRSTVHPVRVYGDSDLQLAYLKPGGVKISQRCLVWPAKMLYGRIYGSGQLERLLTELGYKKYGIRGFAGARVRKIPTEVRSGENTPHTWLMPYMDNTKRVVPQKHHLVLRGTHDKRTGWAGSVTTVGAVRQMICNVCKRPHVNRVMVDFRETNISDAPCNVCEKKPDTWVIDEWDNRPIHVNEAVPIWHHAQDYSKPPVRDAHGWPTAARTWQPSWLSVENAIALLGELDEKPHKHYKLRIPHDNANGTDSSTANNAPVQATNGIAHGTSVS